MQTVSGDEEIVLRSSFSQTVIELLSRQIQSQSIRGPVGGFEGWRERGELPLHDHDVQAIEG